MMAAPQPNKGDVSAHLMALFPPTFVHPYPDARIEIAYGFPETGPNRSQMFSAFDLDGAADFAVARNSEGNNIYVGAALRQGDVAPFGRGKDEDFLAASHAWIDLDSVGAVERAQDLMNELQLQFSMVIRTGAIPHNRAHVYVKIDGGEADGERLRQINIALEKQFGGDHVANPSRVLRLAGTISYPNRAKRERGYSTELVTLRAAEQPFSYAPEQLFAALRLSEPDKLVPQHISRVLKLRRTDDDLERLLQASCVPGQWHNSIRDAVASMIGRGWEDAAIRLSCAEYCTGGASDPDLDLLINGGRRKWDKPNIEGAAERDFCSMADLNRLNKEHAVLPIGGRTRVVTFGEMDEFPGRETIVMTQTIADFKSLKNKYRHVWRDEEGELNNVRLGNYWIGHPQRRQYDGGMAFMPRHDGDVGNRAEPMARIWGECGQAGRQERSAGCQKFLDFMRASSVMVTRRTSIIC